MSFALVPKKHLLPPFSPDIAGSGRKNMSTYFRPKFVTNISGRYTRGGGEKIYGYRCRESDM
jgi:hypothetical protein